MKRKEDAQIRDKAGSVQRLEAEEAKRQGQPGREGAQQTGTQQTGTRQAGTQQAAGQGGGAVVKRPNINDPWPDQKKQQPSGDPIVFWGMTKVQIQWLGIFLIASAVMFYLVPFIATKLPANVGSVVISLVLTVGNYALMGVVGWQSNLLPKKFRFWVPAAVVLLYIPSEMLYFHMISGSLETSYLEIGYLAFFLKKLLDKRRKREEKKNQFPTWLRKH